MNRPAPWRSIMGEVVDRRPFRVGAAVIDPVSRDASWRGGKDRLQPQTLKVLLALVSRRGEVVTRDELVQLCWDGRIVGDDVINRAILLLRHLAERAGGFEIETVPRTGYRLVETQSIGTRLSRRWWIAAAAGILVLGGATGWYWLRTGSASQGAPPTPSITVVPFTAAANDPLTRQVAQAAPASIERMMADSGFAIVRAEPQGSLPPRTDYVFTGGIRRTGGSIQATVQLVSERDGTIRFTHDFDAPLDRAADLPDRIGATEAADLAWTGAEMVLDPRQHLSPAAASELMRAMSVQIEDGDSLQAYQLSRHAASLSPNSAFAQLSVAMEAGFSIDSIPRDERDETLAIARRASDRARAMAPEFGDVYIPWCMLHNPARKVECEARLRKALSVDYRSSFVPGYLSALHYDAGRFDEALQLAEQSRDNDPYKPAKLARMIRMLEATGDSDQAEQVYRQATRLWPDLDRFRASRMLGIAESGNYARLAAVAAEAGDPPKFVAVLDAERKRDLAGARRACASNGLSPFGQALCMTILADLGDRDGSFAIAATLYPAWHAPRSKDLDSAWLDYPERFNTAFLSGPAAQAMRSDPRYLDLVRSLGLLDYWRSGRLPDFCRSPRPEPICSRLRGRD